MQMSNNTLTNRLITFWNSKNLSIVFFLYVAISLLAMIQGLAGTPKIYIAGGRPYTDYNNYVIFKYSFFHLLHNQDIYQYFPNDHWDLYKYSPAFSVFFGLLGWMPDPVGLFIWHLINCLCLYAGVRMLPGLDNNRKAGILLFCLLELLLSIQNTQSNGLMAGLIILGFALAERSKYALSTFCIVFSVYIKLFGGLAFVLYLFYPNKLRTIGWSIFWMVFMAVLPLILVSPAQLMFLYKSWLHLLSDDRSASIGISVMGMLDSWFHLSFSKNMVALTGLILFLLPLIHVRKYQDYYFRLLYLASILLWIVLFNHKAESPTFVIAMSGIGIWYFCQENTPLGLSLLLLSLFFVSLSVSDLVPYSIRSGIIKPYAVKALLPAIVWGRLLYEQLSLRYQPQRLI